MKTKSKISLALLCGILGSLCFGVGDWILGYVDSTPIGENIFYFICVGHSAVYDTWKIVVTLVMAMAGICFLIPGMPCIADVARKSGARRLLRYLFMLCAVGWIVIHFAVAAQITLIILILCGKTRLKRTAALFTPAIPMGILADVSGTLPTSPFAYGLYTFCMNGGLIVWFVYLLFHQNTAMENCDDEF